MMEVDEMIKIATTIAIMTFTFYAFKAYYSSMELRFRNLPEKLFPNYRLFSERTSEVLLMNMNNMIGNIPEDTLISLAVFIGAGIIYAMRKFGSLNQTIREYEQAEKSALQARDDHAILLNNIEVNERLKFSNTQRRRKPTCRT